MVIRLGTNLSNFVTNSHFGGLHHVNYASPRIWQSRWSSVLQILVILLDNLVEMSHCAIADLYHSKYMLITHFLK